jgi:hypothetical protein
MSHPKKDYWQFFSEEAARGRSPLYARLALAVGGDAYLTAIAMRKREGQPAANVLFAAVHALLLRGADHPLAEHYPSVRPGARPAGAPEPLFAGFVRSHEAALLPLIESGVTNTNEVLRSASLLPAFGHAARAAGTGLRLIELGPSAGFNLNFDRYRYQYTREGAPDIARGPADADLVLACALRGPHAPELAPGFPSVLSRAGLERNPIDLGDPGARLWLKALVWPELGERHARLDRAIASQIQHPVAIVAGDALATLPDAVRTAPAGGTILVYHSHVIYQFTDSMRAALDASLAGLSLARPIHRIGIEYEDGAYPIRHCVYAGGALAQHSVLGRCDPHGSWLEWAAA